ncbi:MAG: hypothetical protein UE295_07625 [Acutalibacteraceae bacterium]|nr:hypothetical protein [Acutalibacteraceae bacterium]
MEAYVEQIVKNEKTAKDLLIKVLMIMSIFAVFLLGVVLGVLINGYFIFLGAAGAAFETYFCWLVITGLDREYEYEVTSNNLQIDKIMAKRRRKKILSIDINKIEGFEKVSENRLNADRCDKVLQLGTYDDDDSQYRFVVQTNKYGKVMVVFAPNKKTLDAIKLYLKPEVKVALIKAK